MWLSTRHNIGHRYQAGVGYGFHFVDPFGKAKKSSKQLPSGLRIPLPSDATWTKIRQRRAACLTASDSAYNDGHEAEALLVSELNVAIVESQASSMLRGSLTELVVAPDAPLRQHTDNVSSMTAIAVTDSPQNAFDAAGEFVIPNTAVKMPVHVPMPVDS